MKLLDLLSGTEAESCKALQNLVNQVGCDERLLWYPSAGRDFRDVLEMAAARRRIHGIALAPNVICHTDHRRLMVPMDTKVVHDDGPTRVECLKRYQLGLAPGLCSDLKSEMGRGRDGSISRSRPEVELLKIRMTSATLGVFECSVVYVVMDNDQFFERVLLRHQIQVSHLIKVRQGYRSGGSNPCLSAVYPMMGNLGVRYLIADRQLHFCPHHHMRLLSVMQGPCEDFKVDVQGATFTWSGLGCRVYGVTRTREALTPDSLRYGLGLIAHNPDFEFVAEGTQARARDHAPRCQRQCPKNIELKSTSVIAIHE